jgi:hypothetical protein
MGIHILKLVESNPGGDHSGTMVHFQVALHVAYWLSSEVQVQFSKWIGELLLTGRVELGKEKTPEELDAIWKSRIAEEQAKIQFCVCCVLFVTGALIYFKNKNDRNGDERISATITRFSSFF